MKKQVQKSPNKNAGAKKAPGGSTAKKSIMQIPPSKKTISAKITANPKSTGLVKNTPSKPIDLKSNKILITSAKKELKEKEGKTSKMIEVKSQKLKEPKPGKEPKLPKTPKEPKPPRPPKEPKPPKPPKEPKPPKPPKPAKAARPQKLVQLVPSQKPSHINAAPPVRKDKLLMRFGKPTVRVLYKVDFLLKASPTILYHFITNPAALVRWFCDAVDITSEYYTFSWKGNTEVAELLDDIEDERLRFRWLDGEDDDEFFEYRFTVADITDETIFEIYDFAWADEVEDQKQLWRTQIDRLRKETGDQ